MNEGVIIYEFYNLPLPKVCLSWQTAQTRMRRRILRRLIWVSANCICSLFEYIQPVPQMRTLNFRLATLLHWKVFCENASYDQVPTKNAFVQNLKTNSISYGPLSMTLVKCKRQFTGACSPTLIICQMPYLFKLIKCSSLCNKQGAKPKSAKIVNYSQKKASHVLIFCQ